MQVNWSVFCRPNMVEYIEGTFRDFLGGNVPLEYWLDLIQNIVDQSITIDVLTIEQLRAHETNARRFLHKWSILSSIIMRNMTNRNVHSLGSFQILRILFDEYVLYVVEKRLEDARRPFIQVLSESSYQYYHQGQFSSSAGHLSHMGVSHTPTNGGISSHLVFNSSSVFVPVNASNDSSLLASSDHIIYNNSGIMLQATPLALHNHHQHHQLGMMSSSSTGGGSSFHGQDSASISMEEEYTNQFNSTTSNINDISSSSNNTLMTMDPFGSGAPLSSSSGGGPITPSTMMMSNYTASTNFYYNHSNPQAIMLGCGNNNTLNGIGGMVSQNDRHQHHNCTWGDNIMIIPHSTIHSSSIIKTIT